ncbi:MAG TPA: hypothetical protein VJM79_01815 [Rhizorhapis sp.]|nr:hypothetical protein [Rhizorhapis sp.]
MTKTIFTTLMTTGMLALVTPALAQEAQPAAPVQSADPAQSAQPAPSAQPAQQAAPAAGQMTPEQIAAFNKAVADFTAAQQLQQSGDNAGALAKYEGALPAVRAAVKAQPENKDYKNFLANALYATAAAQAATQKFDAAISSYQEAVPLWREIVAANPADANNRNVLAGMLVQLGNKQLTAQDKAGASPLYKEATDLARKSLEAAPSDPVNKNLLLSALIGLSQTSSDKAVMDETLAMGKKMMAEGSIDAVNKPSIEIMTGQKG